MGYMRHHAIVVTSFSVERIAPAHTQAKSLFSQVSEIIQSPINGYWSFLVAPDGSKEGWQESADGDASRDTFVSWLEAQRYEDGSSPLDWAEVQYGDDDRETKIVRDSDERGRKRQSSG